MSDEIEPEIRPQARLITPSKEMQLEQRKRIFALRKRLDDKGAAAAPIPFNKGGDSPGAGAAEKAKKKRQSKS